MNRVDRLYHQAQAKKTASLSSIRATVAEIDMYLYCMENDQVFPDDGSPEFWSLFDKVAKDCTREEMEQHIHSDPPEVKTPTEVASDPSYQAMTAYLKGADL